MLIVEVNKKIRDIIKHALDFSSACGIDIKKLPEGNIQYLWYIEVGKRLNFIFAEPGSANIKFVKIKGWDEFLSRPTLRAYKNQLLKLVKEEGKVLKRRR